MATSARGVAIFYFPLNFACQSNLSTFKIILGLKVHSTLGIGTEEPCKTQGGIGGNGPFFAGADLLDSALEHAVDCASQ